MNKGKILDLTWIVDLEIVDIRIHEIADQPKLNSKFSGLRGHVNLPEESTTERMESLFHRQSPGWVVRSHTNAFRKFTYSLMFIARLLDPHRSRCRVIKP